MKNKKNIYILLIIFTFGCLHQGANVQEDLTLRFDKAIKYYNKGKFSRAKDEFDYIIMVDSGSKLANDAEYFMAESMFQLEEYLEAANQFERYIRFATSDHVRIEKARYRICECAINASNSYQRDQSKTNIALSKLQLFIEDYPSSDYKNDIESSIQSLRLKLAKKDYEAGRMYLKLEEFESAIIYFQLVLDAYYDTIISDDARIGIIFAYLLNDDFDNAVRYFNSQKQRFISDKKFKDAELLIIDSKEGIKLHQYYKLFK